MTGEHTALQLGFRVRGRVHGVGFRWWTRRTAVDLGLRGVVLNRADGTVEVHAAGESESVERFAAQLAAGPPGSRVDGVERVPSDRSLPAAFEIVSDFGVTR